MRGLALSLAFAPLSPWLLLQGLRVRRDTPRLDPAAGPTNGICVAGSHLPPLRLLAIGESTVAGVGAANHEEALTGQFAWRMASMTGRSVAWLACGLSGASVSTARTILLPRVAPAPADLLLLAFGVNDVLDHTRPARYARDLQALIVALRERVGNAPALIAAAPPMGRFPSLPRPLNAYLGARGAFECRHPQTGDRAGRAGGAAGTHRPCAVRRRWFPSVRGRLYRVGRIACARRARAPVCRLSRGHLACSNACEA